MEDKNQVLFMSHGGGPLPLMGDPGHAELIDHARFLSLKLKQPSAIIVISAHWEAPVVTITHNKQPELIYDYYGFPDSAYDIEYPAAGEPGLAEQLHTLLQNEGINSELDASRGFDHGVFVPLKLLYPGADIPVVQISLVNNLDPATHLQLGHALSKLPQQNLLILGSGFTFHNLRAYMKSDEGSVRMNLEFESWLIDTLSNPEYSSERRTSQLKDWKNAPHARFCHPREEHLLPLFVCYTINESRCSEVYEMHVLNKKVSSYLWQ